MMSKSTEYLFTLILLILSACSSSQSNYEKLNQREKLLVGNWMRVIDNGQVQGWYLEFHEDRSGIFGPVMQADGKDVILPYMSLLMKSWKLVNDTLVIESKIDPNYVVHGSDGKEIKQNDKPSYVTYLVSELSDTIMVLEDLTTGVSLKKKQFSKTEKLTN
ncbi:hypothetical protein GCM10027429_11290 [Marivirga atlantica]|jgi:hypothetical protein|uniref:Lipoprotein n=1 Tax=Marivirga atlantica TaxID=1548457 RepID=A0A937AL75_9BACT|nr:hypothetical protein [Marivirga atlantica]MBL0764742.1 hypothetical protein [Marivirga atlantica]